MKAINTFYVFSIMVLMFWSCSNPDTNLMIKKEINENWTFTQTGKNEWLPAKVPGTVHTDLLKNGKIEDPFYRLNEHDLQWIDKVDWEYKTTFKVENELLQKDVVEIDFKGLDTYADVFVNGKKVLSADNMFREWIAGVKDILKEGENELRIIFRSPITEGIKKYDAQGYVIPVSDNDLSKIGQKLKIAVATKTTPANPHQFSKTMPRIAITNPIRSLNIWSTGPTFFFIFYNFNYSCKYIDYYINQVRFNS